MRNIARRGFQAERDLARKFNRYGFAVIRGPASGRRGKHLKYPDLVALYNKRILVFEVKSISQLKDVYIPREEVDKISRFAKIANGEAYIAVKIYREPTVRIIPIDKLKETSGDKYRLKKEDIEKAMTLEELVMKVKAESRRE
jgi:Holliday junction resolvase